MAEGSGVEVAVGCVVAEGCKVFVGSAVNVDAIQVEEMSCAVPSNCSALKPPSVHAESKIQNEVIAKARGFFTVLVLGKLLFCSKRDGMFILIANVAGEMDSNKRNK